MIAPPPKRLSARFGAVGPLVKRIVERLIRFYTVQQDEVNRNVDSRLADLEAAPIERRGDELDLRAEYGALSARLTYVQREVAALRRCAEELRRAAGGAGCDDSDPEDAERG